MQKSLMTIHNSYLNGQFKQMVKQIQKYGVYNFWEDYREFAEIHNTTAKQAYDNYTKVHIFYNRLKGRK
jgi:hypothetical protein